MDPRDKPEDDILWLSDFRHPAHIPHQRAGTATEPQSRTSGETHVGGSDELHALDRAGKLDALLAG
jgi:glutaredoxin 3